MEIKDFIENFAEQFDDTTVEMLGAGTKFRELDEWLCQSLQWWMRFMG